MFQLSILVCTGLMVEMSDVSLFLAALAAIYLLPGADMALVMSTSALRGTRSGLMTALGLAASRSLHVTLSGLGLAALFSAHPVLLDGVRWIGAAYLVWLAWRVLFASADSQAEEPAGSQAGWAAMQRGFLTNLLNPKALMFCALLLPQFIAPQRDMFEQYVVLGVLLVSVGLLFDAFYALAATGLAKRFSDSPCGQRIQKIVFAGVFGVAAIRLAVGGN
jgi:threonine/homoserine/homoserine lactone efflux protein